MFKRVLVPLDGSELSECSLPYVRNMAREDLIGEVILLKIALLHLPLTGLPEDAVIIDQEPYLQTFREAGLDESRNYLARVESQLKAEGIKVTSEVMEDHRPAESIIDFSQQNSVDLIVMTTHGYTGIKKLLIGSVALNVLHESHVPILLIRPESCRG